MKTKKQNLIKSAHIIYSRSGGDGKHWYGDFKLNIEGFEVGDQSEYYTTIDEEVEKLKERMAEAISKFEKAE